MNRIPTVAMAVIFVSLVQGCGREYCVRFGEHNFRKPGASTAELTSIGTVSRVGVNTWDLYGKPDWGDIPIHVSSDEEYSKKAEHAFKLDLLLPDEKSSVNTKVNRNQKRRFTVRLFYVYPMDLIPKINENVVVKTWLQASPNSRIIIGNAIVYDDKSENRDEFSTKISFGKWREGEAVLINGEEIRRSDGAIIAYRFARMCWDNNGVLVDLREDRPMAEDDDRCPNGTSVSLK